MNDHDFMRYSRQILLGDIAIEGQQKLLNSHVLIVGLGGLGSPAALYLAGAGVGTLTLADDDDVHLSNLQRQILFTTDDIAHPKAQAAKLRLARLNPGSELIVLKQRLTGDVLKNAVARADVVLDCTDNMATRQEINVACVALNTPLITASAVGFGGQLMVLTPPGEQGCYRCSARRCRARAQLPYRGYRRSRRWRHGRLAGAGGNQIAQRDGNAERRATPV